MPEDLIDADRLAWSLLNNDLSQVESDRNRYRAGLREVLNAVRDFKWALDNGIDEFTAVDRVIRRAEDVAGKNPDVV